MQIRSKLDLKKKKRNPLFRRQSSDERTVDPETKPADIGAIGDRPNPKRNKDSKVINYKLLTDFAGDGEAEGVKQITRNCCKSYNRKTRQFYPEDNQKLLNKHGLTKTCVRQQSLPQINQSGSSFSYESGNRINCPSTPSGLKPIDFHDYFNVNSDSDLANNINHYTENRLKLRENIRRNRSFKTISSHDLLVEEPLPPYYSRDLLGRPQTTSASSSSAIDRFLVNHKDDRSQSASFHDLIEQFSSKSKHRSARSNESLTECGGDGSASYQTQPYFENTSPTLHTCEPIARRCSKSSANFHNLGFSLSPESDFIEDYTMRENVRLAGDSSTFRMYNSISECKEILLKPTVYCINIIFSCIKQLNTITSCLSYLFAKILQ